MSKDLQLDPAITPTATVIWLHGLGASADNFYVVGQQLQKLTQLPIRFIFPQAENQKVTIANQQTMPAWFDIIGLDIKSREDRAGLQKVAARLDKIIQTQSAEGIALDRIFLAGFSQGCAAVLYAGLRYPQKLGGIIGYSGYLPFASPLATEGAAANCSMPIFLAHGLQDEVVAYHWGQASCAVLQQHGYTVTWRTYAMPHYVCEQEIIDTADWLKKILI